MTEPCEADTNWGRRRLMRSRKMHADQITTDADLVRRLLKAQFPHWASLAIEPIASGGTANAIYRLGDHMAVRMPLQLGPGKTEQIDKEHQWLPKFVALVPLSVPVPLAKGEPAENYPCPWTVCEWLDGENATLNRLADPVKAAAELARFIRALQQIDPTLGPAPGAHNFFRGVPLAQRDSVTREAIASSEGLVDTDAVASAWEADLNAPPWEESPVWIHGDLAPGNLLVVEGRLAGVIDWGGLGVGDPATDMLPAWNLFVGESRDAFRAALSVADATWARGRGLALSQALVALPYYLETNPAIVRWAHHMIYEVLKDHERGG